MTPQEAQELLDKAKGMDESVLQEHMDWKDVADALQTIANLHYEYDYEVAFGDEWTPQGYEFTDRAAAQHRIDTRRRQSPARLIARTAGEWTPQ